MVKKGIIKKDFSFLAKRKDILAILLFGSYIRGDESKRSDVDICIVAPQCDDKQLIREVYRNLDVHKKKYDVRIFEALPLYIKIQIIEDNEVIFTRDVYELYEYFYLFRKLWGDQEHRQKLTKEEILKILS